MKRHRPNSIIRLNVKTLKQGGVALRLVLASVTAATSLLLMPQASLAYPPPVQCAEGYSTYGSVESYPVSVGFGWLPRHGWAAAGTPFKVTVGQSPTKNFGDWRPIDWNDWQPIDWNVTVQVTPRGGTHRYSGHGLASYWDSWPGRKWTPTIPVLVRRGQTAKLTLHWSLKRAADWTHDNDPDEIFGGGPSLKCSGSTTRTLKAQTGAKPVFRLVKRTGTEIELLMDQRGGDNGTCAETQPGATRIQFTYGRKRLVVSRPGPCTGWHPSPSSIVANYFGPGNIGWWYQDDRLDGQQDDRLDGQVVSANGFIYRPYIWMATYRTGRIGVSVRWNGRVVLRRTITMWSKKVPEQRIWQGTDAFVNCLNNLKTLYSSGGVLYCVSRGQYYVQGIRAN